MMKLIAAIKKELPDSLTESQCGALMFASELFRRVGMVNISEALRGSWMVSIPNMSEANSAGWKITSTEDM